MYKDVVLTITIIRESSQSSPPSPVYLCLVPGTVNIIRFTLMIRLHLCHNWPWGREIIWVPFSSVQLLSRVRLFATPWTATRQTSLSFYHLLGFAQTHVHWVGDAIQPSHPLSSLPDLITWATWRQRVPPTHHRRESERLGVGKDSMHTCWLADGGVHETRNVGSL